MLKWCPRNECLMNPSLNQVNLVSWKRYWMQNLRKWEKMILAKTPKLKAPITKTPSLRDLTIAPISLFMGSEKMGWCVCVFNVEITYADPHPTGTLTKNSCS